jgi:flavorubredoxin
LEFKPLKISQGVHWVGVNDRAKRLFEGLWTIPEGVSYNSYLVQGTEKTVLIDSVLGEFYEEHIEKIKWLTDSSEINYVVVSHMEHDHSESIPRILENAPNATLVYTPMAQQMFRSFFHLDPKSLVLRDDDTTLDLGGKTLHFVRTPFIHWPETLCTYLTETKTLFSCDLFGAFRALPDGNIVEDGLRDIHHYIPEGLKQYYVGVVARYREHVLKALEKFKALDLTIDTVAPSHGPVYTKHTKTVMELWASWSRPDYVRRAVIVVGSMYGETSRFVKSLAKGVEEAGGEPAVLNLVKDPPAKVLAAVIDAPALIIGTSTYEYGLFPPVGYFLNLLEVKKITDRSAGVFGSYAWGGGGVKQLVARLDALGIRRIGDPVEVRGSPTPEDLERARSMAKAVAESAFHERGL